MNLRLKYFPRCKLNIICYDRVTRNVDSLASNNESKHAKRKFKALYGFLVVVNVVKAKLARLIGVFNFSECILTTQYKLDNTLAHRTAQIGCVCRILKQNKAHHFNSDI